MMSKTSNQIRNRVPKQTLLVAVEDRATARAVAAAAARTGMDEGARAVILLHVLDGHTLVNALSSVWTMPAPALIVESTEEGEQVLDRAEAALRGAYAAKGRRPPHVTHELRSGPAGPAILEAAAALGATMIVVGARRPHALGRLVHPDVRAYLAHHTSIPVRVVPLLIAPPSSVSAGSTTPG